MCDTVSVITTILNGEKWIETCFRSILSQNIPLQHPSEYCSTACDDIQLQNNTYPAQHIHENASPSKRLLNIEVCVFDDASTDNTLQILDQWKQIFRENQIDLKIFRNLSGAPKGVGYGRNVAIRKSTGTYLCFQDIDDVMFPNRIIRQYEKAKKNKNAIVGSRFVRLPADSTCRFGRWANKISDNNLEVQIYTSNGPTIIMPTWFCHKRVFDRIPEGFCEDGRGTPEDLLFFYKHLDTDGTIMRCDDVLLIYRYHLEATTFSVSEETIWQIRLKRLIDKVLSKSEWQNGFSIWNAGKQGRKFFRDIPDDFKKNVKTFCDVDQKKIDKKYYNYFDEIKRQITYSVPIIHFKNVKPPIIICIKLDLTNGIFEENLNSLNLKEGKDYIIFS